MSQQHDYGADRTRRACNAGARDCAIPGTAPTDMAPLSTRQRAARGLAGVLMLAAIPLLRALPVPLRRPACAALAWFGTAHVVAAATNYPGCPELGAIPSLLLGRQIKTPCGPWRRIDSLLRLDPAPPEEAFVEALTKDIPPAPADAQIVAANRAGRIFTRAS